jgi:hypothetical protein
MNKGTIAPGQIVKALTKGSSDPAVGCRNKLCQPEEQGPAGRVIKCRKGQKTVRRHSTIPLFFGRRSKRLWAPLSWCARKSCDSRVRPGVSSPSHQVQDSSDNVRSHAMADFVLVVTPIGSTVPHGSHNKVGINIGDIERCRQLSQDRIVPIHHHGRTPIGGWTRRNKTTKWIVIHRS